MISEEKLSQLNNAKRNFGKLLPEVQANMENEIESLLKQKDKYNLYKTFHKVLSYIYHNEDADFGTINNVHDEHNTDITEDYTRNILVRFPTVECLLQNIYGSTEITRDSKFGKLCRKFARSIFGEDYLNKALDHVKNYGHDICNIISGFNKNDHQDAVVMIFEHLFGSFCDKESDVHGVIYTPSEAVNFMVESVHQCLVDEFGIEQGLNDAAVNILDPCTGCGNFISAIIDKQHQIAADFGCSVADNVHGYEISLLSCYVAEVVIGKISADLSNTRTPSKAKLRWCDTLETLPSNITDNQFSLI